MTEVDVIGSEFILVDNPPSEIFKQFVHLVSTTEGWAFQENDYEIWKSCYQKHWMFMVQQKESGRYVASVSLAQSELINGFPLYTVAFFYCLRAYRNRGLGKILFNKAQSIYGSANCFLFGVGTMWQWYEKRYGFKELNPYFHCTASIQIENLIIPKEIDEADGIKIEDVEYKSITEYDRTICQMNREKVMNSWLMASGVYSKMAVDANGNCVGYGAVREVSLNRLSLSPLYADSPKIAVMLLCSILRSFNFKKFASLSTIYPSINTEIELVLAPFCEGNVQIKPFCRGQYTQKIVTTSEPKIFGIRHCAHGYT